MCTQYVLWVSKHLILYGQNTLMNISSFHGPSYLMHKTNKSKWNMLTLVYILKFDLNAKLKHSTLKYSFKAFDILKK